MILIVKGFLIGMGKIIPGVSGAMIAITLGVYEKGVESITHFLKDIKKNTIFLGLLAIGIILSIVILSNFIKISLEMYYLPTMLLFIGLIAGGIPDVYNIVKNEKGIENYIIMSIPCILLIALSGIEMEFNINNPSFLSLILIGMIEAISMVIPGLSGTALMMMIGCYELIIESFSVINLKILFPFAIGTILGILMLVRAINYFLTFHRIKSYYAILGFVMTSVVMLLFETFKGNYIIGNIIISLIFLVLGYIIARIIAIKN